MNQRDLYGVVPPNETRSNGVSTPQRMMVPPPPPPPYMPEMMFDPMSMDMNTPEMMHHTMYQHPPHLQQLNHRGLAPPNMFPHPLHTPNGMLPSPPDEDPRFVDELMSALGPTGSDLNDHVGLNDPQMQTMGYPMHMPRSNGHFHRPQPQMAPPPPRRISHLSSPPMNVSTPPLVAPRLHQKKERRRQQVRYASRRRRKKQKDEESFLRDRIEELKEQIRIINGDATSSHCSTMEGLSEQALAEAYERQVMTVEKLRHDNNVLKEQLLQHENFARMIQYGLNALPNEHHEQDPKTKKSWFAPPVITPTTVLLDLNMCHDAVREAYPVLKQFSPPPTNCKTNVCFAMGWRTELWAIGTCLNFKATRSISNHNIQEVTQASWDIISSPDKCKRIYPDVKHFRVLQKVNDDIVVIHRIASIASGLEDREFYSVAFRFADGNNYFVGLKTIAVQSDNVNPESYIRGEECQGWMFTSEGEESTTWKANYLGYYDVKGEKNDEVLSQLANETMFGMLRWESEAMHPF